MGLHPVALLKINSFTGIFQKISKNYKNTYFAEHTPGSCFCSTQIYDNLWLAKNEKKNAISKQQTRLP